MYVRHCPKYFITLRSAKVKGWFALLNRLSVIRAEWEMGSVVGYKDCSGTYRPITLESIITIIASLPMRYHYSYFTDDKMEDEYLLSIPQRIFEEIL